MTNRASRRAKKAVMQPKKPWPSMHGGGDQCGNCYFSSDREAHTKITARTAAIEINAGRPAPQPLPIDETYCCYEPTTTSKKVWGWCRHWLLKNREPIKAK